MPPQLLGISSTTLGLEAMAIQLNSDITVGPGGLNCLHRVRQRHLDDVEPWWSLAISADSLNGQVFAATLAGRKPNGGFGTIDPFRK